MLLVPKVACCAYLRFPANPAGPRSLSGAGGRTTPTAGAQRATARPALICAQDGPIFVQPIVSKSEISRVSTLSGPITLTMITVSGATMRVKIMCKQSVSEGEQHICALPFRAIALGRAIAL